MARFEWVIFGTLVSPMIFILVLKRKMCKSDTGIWLNETDSKMAKKKHVKII